MTNLTFDWTCPTDLRDQMPIIGGEEQPFTYGELEAEMALLNRAYLEVMEEGDCQGRVFTFPIPTYNITPDFDWESDNAERLSSDATCKTLVRTALSRFRLPYLTVTPAFSICPVHGYLVGEHEFCPSKA